jgi:hypothetical protein
MFFAMLQADIDVLEEDVRQQLLLLQAHEQLQAALQLHTAAAKQDTFPQPLAAELLEMIKAAGK